MDKHKPKYINEFDEHMQVILRKICEVVGADVEKINFWGHNWYYEHEWTVEQQEDYEKWMADYLYNNNGARKEIMAFARKNKKRCKDVAHHFACWYGWKTKDA
jgi:hypothetical protein